MTVSQKIKHIFSEITFKDIAKSISGTEQDFTIGKIGRAMLLISIPMVLEMIMESIFALVDIYFVSQLGDASTATVGITESLMTIIYAIAIGLSAATSAVISRRIGEKRPQKAAESAFQAILLAFLISLAIAIPGVYFARDILILMDASDETVAIGTPYTRIMIGGNVVIMLLFIINAIFRSAGDAAISFRVLAIANILNIILDPVLINGWGPIPAFGVKGAAIATNIGRGMAVLYQLYLLFFGKLRIRISLKQVNFKFSIMQRIINLSYGGIGQHLIATSSWIILIWILNGYGESLVAGYTVAIRIIMFALLPSWGLSNAAATLVGQNLGAGKPQRAEKSIWLSATANLIFLGTISLILILFPQLPVNFLVKDESIAVHAIKATRFISYGFVMYGVGMVLSQSINGSGDTRTPTIINLFSYWIVQVPIAYFLAELLFMGPDGVYISIILAESMLTTLSYIIIKRGKWKTNIV